MLKQQRQHRRPRKFARKNGKTKRPKEEEADIFHFLPELLVTGIVKRKKR